MLVSTALLTVIVLGLTAMLIQTQNAFKTGTKQTTSTDAGRAVIDMIASDLSQLANNQFTNQTGTGPIAGTVNSYFLYPNLWWSRASQLYQYQNGALFRTNQMDDIFSLVQTNNTWIGIGYTVSNWFVNPFNTNTYIPGAGTLYRYTTNYNGPLAVSNILGFYPSFFNTFTFGTYTNCHRIADGIVDLKITAYDADGNEMYYEPGYDLSPNGLTTLGSTYLEYPANVPNLTNLSLVQTNYLPHSVDIEVGILEPEAVDHARALFQSGAITAASNYLANAVGQVEIFRQHIVIPGAP